MDWFFADIIFIASAAAIALYSRAQARSLKEGIENLSADDFEIIEDNHG
jgi:hypothetical protein